MTDFQPAIFDQQSRQHVFLEFIRHPGADDQLVRQAIQRARQSMPEPVKVVWAMGPDLCRRLDIQVPFDDFSLEGVVPATQSDLFVWLQGEHRSDLFDAAMLLREHLQPHFSVQIEQDGFVYHDTRDLTGFVDGIGNPKGDQALAAALVADDQPGAGGSFVMGQLWRHDLTAFKQLSVTDQEQVIGRTKADAVEFDEQHMPVDAHVGRTDVDRDGVPQKIWRRSVPWGNSGQHGLYFLAFSCELARFDFLLRRMYGLSEDGVRDQLTHYSAPQTASYWYAPTQSVLAQL